jgi:hypothetical protein
MKTFSFNKTAQMLFAFGVAFAFHAIIWIINFMVYNS